MYKLRKGVTIPKEFKIKVNADESKALQEYLKILGYKLSCNGGNQDYLFVSGKDKLFYNLFVYNEKKYMFHDYNDIQFKDYFYLDFPEKWCIEVTEDNYKELDVWMHRNWKNYRKYTDKWSITFTKGINEGKRLYSHSDMGWTGSFIKNGFELITTDQFRGKFGNMKVHDVEFVKMGETKVQGTEPCEKDYYGINNDIVEAFNWEEKANYYKEKSDSLRCEKWVMSSEIERHKSEIERLKDAFDAKVEGIQQFKDEIRQLKNIIAENNVTISKQRQEIEFLNNDKTVIELRDIISQLKKDIEFDGDRIKRLEETKMSLKFESDLHNEIIKGLESKIKLLSLR